VMKQRHNLLLLDEPTNHLDLDSREALEESLEDFPGSIVFVSHDRAFIDRLATRVIDLRDGRAVLLPGNYSETADARAERRGGPRPRRPPPRPHRPARRPRRGGPPGGRSGPRPPKTGRPPAGAAGSRPSRTGSRPSRPRSRLSRRACGTRP